MTVPTTASAARARFFPLADSSRTGVGAGAEPIPVPLPEAVANAASRRSAAGGRRAGGRACGCCGRERADQPLQSGRHQRQQVRGEEAGAHFHQQPPGQEDHGRPPGRGEKVLPCSETRDVKARLRSQERHQQQPQDKEARGHRNPGQEVGCGHPSPANQDSNAGSKRAGQGQHQGGPGHACHGAAGDVSAESVHRVILAPALLAAQDLRMFPPKRAGPRDARSQGCSPPHCRSTGDRTAGRSNPRTRRR